MLSSSSLQKYGLEDLAPKIQYPENWSLEEIITSIETVCGVPSLEADGDGFFSKIIEFFKKVWNGFIGFIKKLIFRMKDDSTKAAETNAAAVAALKEYKDVLNVKLAQHTEPDAKVKVDIGPVLKCMHKSDGGSFILAGNINSLLKHQILGDKITVDEIFLPDGLNGMIKWLNDYNVMAKKYLHTHTAISGKIKTDASAANADILKELGTLTMSGIFTISVVDDKLNLDKTKEPQSDMHVEVIFPAEGRSMEAVINRTGSIFDAAKRTHDELILNIENINKALAHDLIVLSELQDKHLNDTDKFHASQKAFNSLKVAGDAVIHALGDNHVLKAIETLQKFAIDELKGSKEAVGKPVDPAIDNIKSTADATIAQINNGTATPESIKNAVDNIVAA